MTEEVIHPLVALREERNLTQIQLAEAVRLGSRTIWAAEHNKPIGADSRRRLCRFFKKSARELGLIATESKARERKRREGSKQSVSVPQSIVTSLSQEQPQITEVNSTSSFAKSLQTGLVTPIVSPGFVKPDALFIRVMKSIDQWSYYGGHHCELQTNIDRELREADSMQQDWSTNQYALTRRDALIMIAGLPLAHLSKMLSGGDADAANTEEFLLQSTASVTACWHLMKGREFALVENILSQYLPKLESLVWHSSKYQQVAANLAAQGCLISGIAALHRNHLPTMETYCQQAVQYGLLSKDDNLHVAALIRLAVAFQYERLPKKMLQTYQGASQVAINSVSPLLRSRVYIGLADAYAECGERQESLRYVPLAYEAFPMQPENDPVSLYADCGLFSLFLLEGLLRLELNQPHEAKQVFEQFEKPQMAATVSERDRIEIFNRRAETSLVLRDMDEFCAHLNAGVLAAKTLGSEKRYHESWNVYMRGYRVWPDAPQVKELRDLFVR